jgi:uncharacterized protein YndB with AHSA1/START domain
MPTKNINSDETNPECEIVVSRVFDAPRELVWEVWTDPEHVAKWWGPVGFSTTIKEMDVRPGGVWLQTMHGPDGSNYPNKSVFREIIKPERIVYSHGGCRENGPGASFTGIWTFEAVEDRKTRVTVRLVFASAEERDFVAREFGAVEGGHQTLARLAEHLASMTSAGEELTIVRVFDAPRELVFKAWTDPKLVMRWWGPKDFTAPFCEIDLRPGGVFRYCMRSPDGKEFWNKGVFHEIIVPEKIVSTMYFSDKDGNRVGPEYYGLAGGPSEMPLDTVTFEVVEGKKTRLTLNRKNLPGISAEFMSGMNQGWNQSLDRFAAAIPRN